MQYFQEGKGIDIGCSRDPLTPTCVAFDKDNWPEVTQRGDASALPFADEEFDWLWSSHCLEDFEDTGAVLSEWLRVLKHGGLIGLYVPEPTWYAMFGSGNSDHKHPGFTIEHLCEKLLSRGCGILNSKIDSDVSVKGQPHYSTLVIARKQ